MILQNTIEDWKFQSCSIDKPCMYLFDQCPVKSECDTLKQCEENWQFLIDNPDVAERNQKVRERHEKEEWERMIELVRDLAKVRIAQGIGGLSFESLLSYLSDRGKIKISIDGVCESSGKSLNELKELANKRMEVNSFQNDYGEDDI